MNSKQRHNNFENSKNQCLGKRDKSSAGRIDPHAVDICSVINARSAYYTTSSCAGRCFFYQGKGIKASESFQRFRVNHDPIGDPARYFNLQTLSTDPTGGGDPKRSVGQFEYKETTMRAETKDHHQQQVQQQDEEPSTEGDSIWLRFEPFILHVACRTLGAASALMAAARPSFKNVGLTTWKDSRYLVAIWGDEGLDAPMTTADGISAIKGQEEWYAQLVNDRHERNWSKIDRFVQAVRDMPEDENEEWESEDEQHVDEAEGTTVPRSFDVIGDVALLHSTTDRSEAEWHDVGQLIMKKNKAIKVVALRSTNLNGTERAAKELQIIAGIQRNPLITTHCEYGIKCVVDVEQTFFSPRMGRERLRLCQQVARGEHVLVLFAGVAMDAFQIAGRTEALSVLAIELNRVAVECAQRAHRMLERNKGVKCAGAAKRLEIRHGDVLEILPTLPRNHYDRILAPRPKEGSLDGDLGDGDSGANFLNVMLPALKQDGGECHWYDFVADHEFPTCERTCQFLRRICDQHGLELEVLHVARVGSVAMRQLRICLDFRIHPKHK